jgi:hypothetical protein
MVGSIRSLRSGSRASVRSHERALRGPPGLQFEALAALSRRRKHYQWYYSTWAANAQMWHCQQGVHDFLGPIFHHKSADWKENRPHRLASWSAAELAKMPTYYIMDLAEDMPATVAKQMPSASQVAACKWPPDLLCGSHNRCPVDFHRRQE